MLSIIKRSSDLRCAVADWRDSKRSVGFVPTMGALHEGHFSLVRQAMEECDRVVVSIFVNPLQFDRQEDLDSYPETFEADRSALADLGVHALYMPRAQEFYPPGFATRVGQVGLTDHLCGATRPGHFDGVLTVVLKLFVITVPDRAYFGAKDFQQAAVIKRMVADLELPLEVRTCPIVREKDGLALSSRNALLQPEHREVAPGIREVMLGAAAAFREGRRDGEALRRRVREGLEALPGAVIDYVEICDPQDLTPRAGEVQHGDLLALAVFFGEVRLIDNLQFGQE